MKTKRRSVETWEIFSIVLITVLKVISYFCLLFLIKPQPILYSYTDIADSFYPYLVDVDHLQIMILYFILAFIIGASTGFAALCSFRKTNSRKTIKLIFLLLLITSIMEMLFCFYRYTEFQNIYASLDSCGMTPTRNLKCDTRFGVMRSRD